MTSTAQRYQQPEATQVALRCQPAAPLLQPNYRSLSVTEPAKPSSLYTSSSSTFCPHYVTQYSLHQRHFSLIVSAGWRRTCTQSDPSLQFCFQTVDLRRTHKCLMELYGDFLYDISHKSVKKCGQCMRKFVTVAAVCCETRVQSNVRRKKCPNRVSQHMWS